MPESKIEDVLCVVQYYWHLLPATTLYLGVLNSGRHEYVAWEIHTSRLVCVFIFYLCTIKCCIQTGGFQVSGWQWPHIPACFTVLYPSALALCAVYFFIRCSALLISRVLCAHVPHCTCASPAWSPELLSSCATFVASVPSLCVTHYNSFLCFSRSCRFHLA